MLVNDDETLLLVIQAVSLVLIAIQYIPQIKMIYQEKEDAVKNLSLASWVYKVGFSVFFVLTLFLTETTMIVAVGQVINLSLSAVVLGQIVYYSHVLEDIELIPIVHTDGLIGVVPSGFLKGEEDEVEYKDFHLVPIIHDILKQLYFFNEKGNFVGINLTRGC